MRIVIVRRIGGEYTDGVFEYDLVEVFDHSHLATTKEIAEGSSADDYAKSLGWEKSE